MDVVCSFIGASMDSDEGKISAGIIDFQNVPGPVNLWGCVQPNGVVSAAVRKGSVLWYQ